MAKIGTLELFVVILIAFFAIGPERLPKAARMLGSAMGKLKKEYNAAKKELLDGTEEFKSIGDELKSVKKTFATSMSDAEHRINRQGQDIKNKLTDKKNDASSAGITENQETENRQTAKPAAKDPPENEDAAKASSDTTA